jgi:predicted ATPase
LRKTTNILASLELMPTNALDYITIQGFKSIASIEKLPLKPINVVIGPNGSGKSNFIGVFAFLHAIREGRLRDYVTVAGGAEKILHFGSKTTREIHFDLSFAQGHYSLKLRPTAADELYKYDEETYPGDTRPDHYDHVVTTDEQGANWDDDMKRELDHLLNWRIYHFHDTSFSSPMRKTAKVDDNRFLRPNGANLPAFLYFLRKKHETSYHLIVRAVQRVAPFFDDFLLEPRRVERDDIKLEWRHKKSEQYFDASSLSDGTLRFIALATLFLQPEQDRPSLILVDEPELGLHPYAIEMLAALVRPSVSYYPSDRLHSIVFAVGSFCAGGRLGRQPCGWWNATHPSGVSPTSEVARRLQSWATMGKERVWRKARSWLRVCSGY